MKVELAFSKRFESGNVFGDLGMTKNNMGSVLICKNRKIDINRAREKQILCDTTIPGRYCKSEWPNQTTHSVQQDPVNNE